MKLNRFMIVSIILLAIISIGAASAVSDDAAADDAVGVTEELEISASDVDEIATDSGNDDAVGSDDNDDSKLGASADEDELSAGTVAPTYTIDVTPNATDAGKNYVAQYGQIITVKGDYGNATGNVSIRFGFSGNYYYHNNIPLVDGKFSENLTDYDRVRNNFQIQVSYTGDDYYKSATWTKNIHVQMANVTANSADYGLNPYMDVDLFDATGNVTFTLNGRNYTKKLENGKTTQEFTNYTLGKNTVTMYYEGDGVIKPIEKDFTFTVDVNVRAPTIYNYQPAIVEVSLGQATGKVNFTFNNKTEEVDIVSGVATTELKDYVVGNNTFEIAYSGDDTFNPFVTNKILTVLGKEDAKIISSVYQTASQNFIFINVPYANGTINVTVNGKKEVWGLVNGTVKKDIAATDKINELIVSYEGNVRLNPTTSSFYVNLTDYIVNNKTFMNYFDISNGGKLYDFIEEGVTLDFQGIVFINTNSENELNIEISKPINIISSTNDAYIDLNTTAGSLLGEHPGSRFIVGRAGSGSNITGIKLHNTQLWISNTTNVVFDNISVVVEDQRVGSGNGATSVRDNSSYVTLKNSYFYTRNNGGSTTFTFAWANYCTFDNNTVVAEGDVGNLLYLNVYNIQNLPGPTKTSWGDILPNYPLNNHNVFSNNELFGKEGSAISIGIMVEGEYNVIANNTLHRTSISTSSGATGANNNIYYGNVLEAGSSFNAQPYSIIYNNYLPGAKSFAVGSNSVAYNNTIEGSMTVTAGATAYNNTVGSKMTVAAGSTAYNNTVGELTISGAAGIAHDNIVNGTVNVNGADAEVYGNIINGDLVLKGNNANAYKNTVTGTISGASAGAKVSENTANEISLTGANVVVSGNDVNAITLTGNNVTVNGNNISGKLSIGEDGSTISSVIYDNIVYLAPTIYGNESTIYNNKFNGKSGPYSLYIYANNCEIYDNFMNGTVSIGIQSKGVENLKFYNNELDGALFILRSTNVEVHNNFIGGNHVNGLPSRIIMVQNVNIYNNTFNAGGITVSGSKINIQENYVNNILNPDSAIILSATYTNVTGNTLYDTMNYGDDAVEDEDEEETNIIEGNYPIKPTLTISADNITVGQSLRVTVSSSIADLPDNAIIQVIANGIVYDAKIKSGTGNAYFFNLPAGEYGIVAISEPYGVYGKAINSTTVKVSKLNPNLELNVSDALIGEDVNVTVSIPDATGNITFIVDGVETNVELAPFIVYETVSLGMFHYIEEHLYGVANYTIKNIAAGDHSIFVIYSGDAKNEAISKSTAFTLTKATPSVDVVISDLKLGEDAIVTVTIANATGKVNIIVDGAENLVDLVDGVATATISKVTAGTHTVVANYAGDAKNNAAFATASKTLTVLPTEITDVNVGGDLNINAVLKDINGKGIENATILYKVGTQNVTNTTTGINGTFTIKGEENAKVEISYAGSDLLFPSSTVISLSEVAPTRVASVIEASDFTCNAVDTAAGEKGTMFKVTLSDASGKLVNATVQFALDGKIYNATTDENGVASVQVNINNANTYTCAVSYLGDIKHDAAFTAVKVVVNKKKTKLTAKKKTFKKSKKVKKYTATLKTTTKSADGKTYFAAGKKVTLKIKGKTYTAKTNKKGKVTFKIKKLTKKGKHLATIKFAGDSTYKGATKKVKITIK